MEKTSQNLNYISFLDKIIIHNSQHHHSDQIQPKLTQGQGQECA